MRCPAKRCPAPGSAAPLPVAPEPFPRRASLQPWASHPAGARRRSAECWYRRKSVSLIGSWPLTLGSSPPRRVRSRCGSGYDAVVSSQVVCCHVSRNNLSGSSLSIATSLPVSITIRRQPRSSAGMWLRGCGVGAVKCQLGQWRPLSRVNGSGAGRRAGYTCNHDRVIKSQPIQAAIPRSVYKDWAGYRPTLAKRPAVGQ